MQSSLTERKDQQDETMETETDQPAMTAPPPQNDKKRKTKSGERRRRQQRLQKTLTTKTTTTEFKLDPSTANGSLALSADHATATYVRGGEDQEVHPAAHHPARFSFWQQVLCTRGLTGGGDRWLWEVEVTGWVSVGLTYDSIARGRVDSALLGYNAHSWSMACSEVDGGGTHRYTACHKKTMVEHRGGTAAAAAGDSSSPPPPPPPSSSVVIGVYLDWDAGDLTFYRGPKGSEHFRVLHSFSADFTAPLYPAFRLGWHGSSVSLLQLTRM